MKAHTTPRVAVRAIRKNDSKKKQTGISSFTPVLTQRPTNEASAIKLIKELKSIKTPATRLFNNMHPPLEGGLSPVKLPYSAIKQKSDQVPKEDHLTLKYRNFDLRQSLAQPLPWKLKTGTSSFIPSP